MDIREFRPLIVYTRSSNEVMFSSLTEPVYFFSQHQVVFLQLERFSVVVIVGHCRGSRRDVNHFHVGFHHGGLNQLYVLHVLGQGSAVVLDILEVISFEVCCCRRRGTAHNAQVGILQIFSLAGVLFLHMAAGNPASELSLQHGGQSPHVNQIDELNKIANRRGVTLDCGRFTSHSNLLVTKANKDYTSLPEALESY